MEWKESCAVLFLIFIWSFQGTRALSLYSSPSNGATTYACTGHTAEFPWRMSLGSGETLVEIQWFFERSSKDLVAIYAGNHFMAMPGYTSRVEHLHNAGLRLNHVTTADEGTYRIEASGHDSTGTFRQFNSTVRLDVETGVETPVVSGGHLQVHMNPTAIEYNGRWYLDLTCGTFTSRGQPSVDVIWRTPSGSTMYSSSYSGGKFHLRVSSPITGGNYSCHIPQSAPAALCLSPGATVLREGTLNVDETVARLILLEAENNQLKTEQQSLINRLHQVEHQVVTVNHIENEISQIQSRDTTQSRDITHIMAALKNLFRTEAISEVRLSGGGSNYGRVEVRHGQGSWGTVCDDSWDTDDARVICRMLGHHGSVSAYQSAHYGAGSGSIYLDEVQCRGDETDINFCNHNPIGHHDCSHSEDASVYCYS